MFDNNVHPNEQALRDACVAVGKAMSTVPKCGGYCTDPDYDTVQWLLSGGVGETTGRAYSDLQKLAESLETAGMRTGARNQWEYVERSAQLRTLAAAVRMLSHMFAAWTDDRTPSLAKATIDIAAIVHSLHPTEQGT